MITVDRSLLKHELYQTNLFWTPFVPLKNPRVAKTITCAIMSSLKIIKVDIVEDNSSQFSVMKHSATPDVPCMFYTTYVI